MEETITAADGGETGVTGAAAVPQTGEENAPAAGVQPDLDAEFESLIKGRFKAQYDARMQDTIQKRLRGARQTMDRFQELMPLLDQLGRHYGADPGDPAALQRAMEENYRENADRLFDAWRQQEQEVKALYPGFSMEEALENPMFTKLIQNDVDVRTAYEVLHRDEIIPAAMEFAARAMEQHIARRIAAGGDRPSENGMGGRAAAVVKQDVSKLSKSDIDEVARRVARGERVSFG